MGEDKDKYDLIILGQGSAAFAAAIKANDLRIKTALVGSNATPGAVVGGTCVNVGCVPSKRLITVGTLFRNAVNNSFEGIEYRKEKLSFRKVIHQKDQMVRKFRKEKYGRLEESGPRYLLRQQRKIRSRERGDGGR